MKTYEVWYETQDDEGDSIGFSKDMMIKATDMTALRRKLAKEIMSKTTKKKMMLAHVNSGGRGYILYPDTPLLTWEIIPKDRIYGESKWYTVDPKTGKLIGRRV